MIVASSKDAFLVGCVDGMCDVKFVGAYFVCFALFGCGLIVFIFCEFSLSPLSSFDEVKLFSFFYPQNLLTEVFSNSNLVYDYQIHNTQNLDRSISETMKLFFEISKELYLGGTSVVLE
jgi:hypothetical protein